jgi:uncharacterized membrane protein YqjE
VRVLWSLPRAAPALLRHIAAYAELAGQDLARTHREVSAELLASAMVAISVFFAALMGCVAVVAASWDTPYRVAAIAWMGGGFLVLAVLSALYRSKVVRERSPFLSSVRREWQEDRVILERILSTDQER